MGDCLNRKMGKIVCEKGMIFEYVFHFRSALKDYAIEQGFKLVRDKNEKNRF